MTNITGPRCRWVAAVIPLSRGEVLHSGKWAGFVAVRGSKTDLLGAGKEARSPVPQSQTPPVTALGPEQRAICPLFSEPEVQISHRWKKKRTRLAG